MALLSYQLVIVELLLWPGAPSSGPILVLRLLGPLVRFILVSVVAGCTYSLALCSLLAGAPS